MSFKVVKCVSLFGPLQYDEAKFRLSEGSKHVHDVCVRTIFLKPSHDLQFSLECFGTRLIM